MNVIAAVFVAVEGGGEEHHNEFQAHNWFLPETKEIVLGGLAFLLIALLLWRKALPAAKRAYAARTQRIATQLDESAAARAAAEADAARVRSELAGADEEAARIVAEARAAAQAFQADAAMRIEDDIAEARTRALQEITTAGGRSSTELQAHVAEMSIGAAELLVRERTDPATQQALIEQFIRQVGANGRVS